MFTTFCPGCESSLNASDTLKGKKVKCKKCGAPFVARPAVTVDDENEPTEEGPSFKRKKPPRRPIDEDTEIMEAQLVDDDEEPRPRRRKKGKGKRKKQSESRVVLYVLIGVGALLVLGGGAVGAYYGFIKEDKKAEIPTAKNNTPGGGSAGPKSSTKTAGWVEHVDTEGKYRILFPTTPVAKSQRVQQPDGTFQQLTMYGVETPAEFFAATHVAIPSPAQRAGLTDEQVLQMVLDQVMAKANGKGAVEKSRTAITYQGFAGMDLVIEDKDRGGTVRGILAGNRLIILVTGSKNGVPNSARSKAFFDSLKIE